MLRDCFMANAGQSSFLLGILGILGIWVLQGIVAATQTSLHHIR